MTAIKIDQGIMQRLTVTITLPRMFVFRIWLGCQLMRLGGVVAGCRIVVETSETEAK
jgi:hypothetical protein